MRDSVKKGKQVKYMDYCMEVTEVKETFIDSMEGRMFKCKFGYILWAYITCSVLFFRLQEILCVNNIYHPT